MKNLIFNFGLLFLLSSFSVAQQDIKSVYFKNDSYELSSKSKLVLKNCFELFDVALFEIYGYADINGSTDYNLELSNKRAFIVKQFLINNGIDSTQIHEVIGKGENSKFEDLSKNRRVDVVIKKVEPIKKELVKEKNIDTVLVTREIITKIPTETKSNNLNDITNLQVGQTLLLENFQFYPGRHIPLKGSEKILKKLVKILEDNPTLKIEIQGHICCQPSGTDGIDNDTGEWGLSINRAKYVYQYLIKEGIDPSRLSYKGFGASKPLVEETNSEAMQMNRRVEIMVVEK
jgi:outer membrane protein OmpA-like peptidoglycan-associated protein